LPRDHHDVGIASQEIVARRFAAEGEPWANLVIAGAMGVRQDFYEPLARFLAANGVHVLTFDYGGMGYSRRGSLRGFKGDVSRWAERDLNGMLFEAQSMAPRLPLLYLGHSLGGQLLGVLPDAGRVQAALTVTAGSGYYRMNDRMPMRVRILWFAAIPALTSLFGYFPGKSLRIVGDLPSGVAWQWRRWCLHPEYLLAEGERYRAAFKRVAMPIRGYSFEDDPMIQRPAIDHLHSFYSGAQVERRHLAPADVGARSVGHFGFFSERSRDTLWRESLDWLRDKAATAS
jgi:predicted alpha/beta hydrolase